MGITMHAFRSRSFAIVGLVAALTFVSVASGQVKTTQPQTKLWVDTSLYMFRMAKQQAKLMGLSDLLTSTDTLHFRFWADIQAIDIRTTDFTVFYGQLINRTARYENSKKGRTTTPIFRAIALDTSVARQVYQLFTDSAIFKIPTQDSIGGWGDGTDGIAYVIEYSTPSFYSCKQYWTPSYFKDIKEAIVITHVADRLEELLNMNKVWYEFLHTLPKGCYSGPGIVIICTKANEADGRKMLRKHR